MVRRWQGLSYQLLLSMIYYLKIVLMGHYNIHSNTTKAFKHRKYYNKICNLIIFYTNTEMPIIE